MAAAVDSNEAIKGILRSWTIGGIIPTAKHKVIFTIYSLFINIFVNLIYPCTLIIDWFENKDMTAIIENISFQISIISCSCKHFTLFFATNNIQKIKELLQKLDQQATADDEQKSILYIAKLGRGLFSAWVCLYYSSLFMVAIVKFYAGQKLLYPAWFPFDLTVRSNLWIALGYQMGGMILLALENACVDSFPTIFLLIMAVHIEVLGLRIKKIGQVTQSEPAVAYDQLTGCIEDHKDVLQLFEEMSQVIKGPMTVQIFFAAFVVCTEAINLLFLITSFTDIFAHCCYAIAIILQILPACYCMNRVNKLNAGLTGSIYQCNWIVQELKFKKTLIIFMQNTQQNLILMAANIAPINLSTFISIIKISFSMFTILSELNK